MCAGGRATRNARAHNTHTRTPARWSLREHFKAFETKFAKIYETAEKKEER